MTKSITRICFLFVFCTLSGFAQEGFSKQSTRMLDSALDILDMSRRDLGMRADAVNFDHQRLSLVNKLFTSPWKSGELAAYYSRQAKYLSYDNADLLFSRVMSDTQLGVYQPSESNADTSLLKLISSIHTADGVELSRTVLDNFTLASIVQQYVLPTLKAAQQLELARARVLTHSLLLAQCDSLLMMSEDDATASPYELKAAELRADSLSQSFFDDAASCDMQKLCSGGLSIYRQLLAQANTSQSALQLLRDSVRSLVFETKYGPIALGGAGSDRYERDYLLIVDVGGDDFYHCSLDKNAALSKGLRVVIDLSGNDVYMGSSYSIACGIFGVGIVIDMSGNDSYKAGSFSLGAGLFGVGILHDAAGTDSYQGGVFSQGAGAFGVGLLVDDSGNDSYTVQAYGQGFGYCGGFGMIADKKGNDVYTTQSPFVDILRYDSHFVSFTQGASLGQRPYASGGIGLLLDAAGNDSYSCDIYGQGSAYWFGYAALVDDEGEDRYSAYQYAQGAGIHFAHGLLWDRSGDDVYVSHGVSQGCGHDVGAGILVDEQGNDSYVAESLSLGAGNANAVSIFIDEKGDDSYIARNLASCMGYSDFRRNYGMIGVFIDGAGNDLYGESSKNNTVSTKSSYGAFVDYHFDLPASSTASTKASTEPTTASPKLVLSTSLDSLYVQASTAPQKYQYMVNPARDKIISMYERAIPFCAQHFSTANPRERLALEYMIPKLYEKDSIALTSLLQDSLNSPLSTTLNFVLWSIGKLKLQALSAPVQRLCRHSDWRIRAAAAQQIGEAGMNDAITECELLIKDTIAPVRMRAAYSIAQLEPARVGALTKQLNKENFQIVRNALGCGLRAHKNIEPAYLAGLLDNCINSHLRHSLLLALPALDSTKPTQLLTKALLSLDDDERESAYRTLAELKAPYWQQLRDELASAEKNDSLKTLLYAGSEAARGSKSNSEGTSKAVTKESGLKGEKTRKNSKGR